MELGKAFVVIEAQNKLGAGLAAAEGQVKKSTEAMTAKLAGIGKGLTIAGAAITAVSIGLIKMASDSEETASKFAIVFKDVSDEAAKMAKNLADNFGLSTKASKQLLSDTGDLLTGFGFTGKAALDLSVKVNELAVDLASFTNYSGGAEGASAALTKALLGEREGVKSLGISILETDVKAKVLEMTQQGLTFETERQAKAYATLLIAQEQSKNAMGDFSRTSGGFANQMRILKANVSDVAIALGEKLLPIATELTGKVIELVKRINEWIKANPILTEWIIKVGATLGVLAAVGGPILMATAAFLKLAPAIKLVQIALLDLASGGTYSLVIAAVASFVVAYKSNLFGLKTWADGFWEYMKEGYRKYAKFIYDMEAEIGAALITKAQATAESMKNIDLFTGFTEKFKKVPAEVIPIFDTILAEVERMAGIGDLLQPAEEAIQKIVDSFTPYEKQLEAINVKYDEAIEKIKTYITNEDELKAAIDKLNQGKEAEITLLERQKTELDKIAEAYKTYIEAMKSVEDRLFELTHTQREAELRQLNTKKAKLIEIAKQAELSAKEEIVAIKEIMDWYKKELGLLSQIKEGKRYNVFDKSGANFASVGSEKAQQMLNEGYNVMEIPSNTPTQQPGQILTEIPKLQHGTPYVPKTGLYQLHQGEKVTPASQNKYNYDQRQSFSPVISISIAGDGDERKIKRVVDLALNESVKQFRRSGFELVPGRA